MRSRQVLSSAAKPLDASSGAEVLGARFAILGPVEAMGAGPLAPRHRAVLAYLLLNARRAVSAEGLIDAVWGLTPPDTAKAQIHAAVAASAIARRFEDEAAALAWLDAERDNLIAVAAYAASTDWPAHTALLATILYRYLDDHAHHSEAIDLYTQALHSARRLGDQAAEVRALLDLDAMNSRQGRYGLAHEHACQALEIARLIGDRRSQARALCSLGDVFWHQRDDDQANEHYLQTLEMYREIGDRSGEAIVLGNLGLVDGRQGRFEQARGRLHRALDLFQSLGMVGGQGTGHGNLGLVCQWQGHYEEAVAHHRQALEFFAQIDYRSGEADNRNALGEAARHSGAPREALAQHDIALDIARDIGNRPEQGRAHYGLARAHQDLGDRTSARGHAGQALDIYIALRVPEAAEARTLFSALSAVPGRA